MLFVNQEFSDRLTASEVLSQKWLAISQSPVEAEDQPITKRVRRRSRKNAEVKQVSDQSAPLESSCDFGPIGESAHEFFSLKIINPVIRIPACH